MHQQRLISRVLLAILIMIVGIVSITAWAAPPISETFRGTTATNWTLSGNAYLTAPSLDADGSGWLRLTDAAGDQSGTALYNVAFNSNNGTQIAFYYATYGGSGADGISFFLVDGTAPASYGGVGGSLGYSYRLMAPAGPGVTGGVLGVGLDEYGNFANNLDNSIPNPYGESGRGSSRYPGLTVRGSGTGNSDYDYVSNVAATIATGSRAGIKRVEITITPAMLLTVKLAGVTLISNLDVTAYVTVPSTLKMGFSSSTGGSTNIHEIRDLTVGGASPSTTVLTTVPDPSILNVNACFQATVTGDDGGDPEGIVKFYNGTTYLGEATIAAGAAEFCYSGLAEGTYTINAEYQGDSKYAGSVGTDPHEVINDIPTTTTVVDDHDPSLLGTSVCFTATVTPDSFPPATGTVTFLEGITVLGTATLSGGMATFCTSALTLGPHTITARYDGNPPYLTSSDTEDHLVIAPEIDVQRPASIPDGGTDDIGTQPVLDTVNLTYTIDNTAGTAQLDVTCSTGSDYVNCSGFAMVSALPINIVAGGSGTMQVSFDVTMIGPFSFIMHICSNDANEDPYDITIEGVGLADVNGDGVDDVLDVRLVFAHVSGCSLLSGIALDRADIDRDGDVDMDDAIIYAEYVIGMRP